MTDTERLARVKAEAAAARSELERLRIAWHQSAEDAEDALYLNGADPAHSPNGVDAEMDADDEAPEETPLRVPELPPYPLDALPFVARRFVSEAAAALGAPPEMIGPPLLGFAAAAIGNRRWLHVKRGYVQRAILWVAVVALPGTAKTPGIDYAREPLSALQRAAKATWDTRRKQYERDLSAWLDLNKAGHAAIAKPTPPTLEHFITTDSTKEALAVMAASSAGIAVVRDELTAWTSSFDAYRSGRGGDRQDMLSLWSGTPLKIDRKGADPLLADRPTVSVVGGVQPDRLALLAGEAGQDGFLDRVLWTYPDVPALRWSDDEVRDDTERALCERFADLRRAGSDTHPDGVPVRLHPEALAAFRWWHDENADAQGRVTPAMRGIYAKLPNQLLRIALVLHCLEYPDERQNVLTRATLEAAIALTAFHTAHAAKVMTDLAAISPMPVSGVGGRILRIMRILHGKYGDGWVPRSEIYRRLRTVTPEALTAALGDLEAAGRLVKGTIPTATKPAEVWRL